MKKAVSRSRRAEREANSATPAQQDEADIVAEAEVERDEGGELLTSEDKIRELGAMDAESVRENRRTQAVINKHKGGEKGVPFNTDDPIVMYDGLLRVWPTSSLHISLKRMTGSKVQEIITSHPRSGVELYEAIKAVHGQHAEAEYVVRFVDVGTKQFKGTGRITMPDTRPTGQPQGQPMNPYYPPYAPPGYPPPPPGYPQGYLPPGYPPQQPQPQPQPQQPAAAQPAAQPQPQQQYAPPVVVHAPPGPDMNAMLTSVGQMLEMFQRMQHQLQPGVAPQAAPPPQQYAPPPYAQPPPAGADMGGMMTYMQQMFDMFRRMQPAPVAPVAPAAPTRGGEAPQQPQSQQPQPTPAMMAAMGMPPVQPPPGTMWVPGFGFIPIDRLMQAVGVGGGPPPYRGGPPPYQGGPPPYQGRSPYQGGPPPYQGGPPQRERTPAEQFREALTVVRTAVEAVQDINEMLPNAHAGGAPQEPDDDDDNPIKIIDTGMGKLKLAVGKDDGRMRWAETGMMALPDVLKWAGEQRELIQKAHTDQRQREQPRSLPPGYVEVGPGYQPPPGYVAVPVDPQTGYAQHEQHAQHEHAQHEHYRDPLPPPPVEVPPPIQPAPQPRHAWGAPPTPGEE